ncbi:MAG: aromatic ring-hydroxylating dioxygenase subunit alpha [Rhodocyclaceae bacterium]|nr:MAG: aromatic ring-hydroxylating dioxygenase subunit alpha [Rhodocyclaceae bacterium]
MQSQKKSPYLLNAWYVAALSTEVPADTLFPRKLLDTSVVIYRKQDGTAVAMQDRCPHRFVPLHMGKLKDDQVTCPYHALRFDCEGKCTHNPHGNGHIPAAAKVRTFPLVEKYGFLWIWMGDQPADEAKLPDYSPLSEGHPNAVGYTYMYRDCYYELITDNVMDLSHIDHLHGDIITTRGQLSPVPPKVTDHPEAINARWEWKQTPAMLIFNSFLPDPQAEARHFFDITWSAPANIQLSVGAIQGPGNLDLKDCVGQYDLHTSTPETEGSTHYFFATRRNHIVEDAEYNAAKIKGMHEAFVAEDGPVLDEVHKEMGTTDLLGLDPVLLPSDVAPVKVRRLLQKLISVEQKNA